MGPYHPLLLAAQYQQQQQQQQQAALAAGAGFLPRPPLGNLGGLGSLGSLGNGQNFSAEVMEHLQRLMQLRNRWVFRSSLLAGNDIPLSGYFVVCSGNIDPMAALPTLMKKPGVEQQSELRPEQQENNNNNNNNSVKSDAALKREEELVDDEMKVDTENEDDEELDDSEEQQQKQIEQQLNNKTGSVGGPDVVMPEHLNQLKINLFRKMMEDAAKKGGLPEMPCRFNCGKSFSSLIDLTHHMEVRLADIGFGGLFWNFEFSRQKIGMPRHQWRYVRGELNQWWQHRGQRLLEQQQQF